MARRAGVNVGALHVTNGESAGNTLRQTSLGGAVLPWQDVLHEGPVPAGTRRELLSARAAFLSGCGWGSRRGIAASLARRDRTLIEALRDQQHVVLWFEHDLYDQLQLLDILGVAATADGALELVVVGSFPGKPSFRGLGELTASQLESLWPSRVAATPDMLAAAASAWDALRQPEPSALAALATAGVAELPFLGVALGPRRATAQPARAGPGQDVAVTSLGIRLYVGWASVTMAAGTRQRYSVGEERQGVHAGEQAQASGSERGPGSLAGYRRCGQRWE